MEGNDEGPPNTDEVGMVAAPSWAGAELVDAVATGGTLRADDGAATMMGARVTSATRPVLVSRLLPEALDRPSRGGKRGEGPPSPPLEACGMRGAPNSSWRVAVGVSN